MRIFYHLSHYISHRVAGLEYIECLKLLGHELSSDPEQLAGADLAILHDDPLGFAEILERFPALRAKPRIAYSVWENELLPDLFTRGLALVDEIWTPSEFSRQSMLSRFSKVSVLPHVVRRTPPGRGDLAAMRERLKDSEGSWRFLSIIDAVNPRKNLDTLLRAFSLVRSELGRRVRLILKPYRVAVDYSSLPGVTCLNGELKPGEISALHSLCDSYVSAHHAEGWGLGLSESMSFGKTAIATAYSGNLEFMNESNSLLVPYTLVPVSARMCERLPLFRPDMRWAEIDFPALVRAMRDAAMRRVPPEIAENASGITRRFSREAVAAGLKKLLDETAARAQNSLSRP